MTLMMAIVLRKNTSVSTKEGTLMKLAQKKVLNEKPEEKPVQKTKGAEK